uniref:Venom protein n=1 Tax=Syphacia muris TaxID=451379 RepID=A0A0N5AHN4_9BILA
MQRWFLLVIVAFAIFTVVSPTEMWPTTDLKRSRRNVPACEPFHVCFSDQDCRGGTCVGINIGKCNCYECINNTICSNDDACGGLSKACGKRTHRCNCYKGFVKNGLLGTYDEVMKQCVDKFCVPDTHSCFGLPCNSGLCYCYVL